MTEPALFPRLSTRKSSIYEFDGRVRRGEKRGAMDYVPHNGSNVSWNCLFLYAILFIEIDV